MEGNPEEATPRALINMMLHRNDPTRTVRPATRRKRKSAKKESRKSTPRTLISELLRNNEVEKTVRVSVRNLHPKIVQRERNIVKDVDTIAIESEVENAKTSESLSEPSNTVNADLEPVIEETSPAELDANNNKPTEVVSLKNNTEDNASHSAGISSKLRNLRRRNKRIRLSNIHLQPVLESHDLDTFTEDLLSKVHTLVQEKLNKSANESRTDSITHALNKRNINTSGISRIDASTSPMVFESNNKELQVDNTEIPPSEDEVSSELGPLSLSRLSEVDLDTQRNSSSPQNSADRLHKRMSKQLSSGTKHSSLKREVDIVAMPDDDIETFQDMPMLTTSTPRGKKKHDKTATRTSNQASPRLRINLVATPPPRNRSRMSLAQKILSSAKASKTKRPARRKPLRRKKHVPNGLPISTAQLKGILRHYSSKKLSKAAIDQIETASRLYFEQTASFFNVLEGKKSKIIKVDDITSLMKRRRHITRKNPISLLIEEHFPLEYREELIPVATSGNSVFLK